MGALGVTLPYEKDGTYDGEAKFFGIVGSMIGQALRVRDQLLHAGGEGRCTRSRKKI